MMHNTEDKRYWVDRGRSDEDVFVQEIAPALGLNAEINPEKARNPYVPDLLVDGQLADLKHQTTPFFKAHLLYRIPNQFAVTFNRKDYQHYQKYPGIIIYYWVDWQELSKVIRGETFTVEPLSGVWRVPFDYLAAEIQGHRVPLHPYQRRVGDTAGNALDSFVFDLRNFEHLMPRVGRQR